MHMADTLLDPKVALTMYALSTAAAGISVHQISKENNKIEGFSKKVPLMGVMGAFVFATQMINFTIPGTGSSGHLCGGVLLSAILGPWCAFLTMISVLLIQSLFFADGGLLALGANIWNMAFYGCFVGSILIWRPMMKKSCSITKIICASILACITTLELGAFSVVLQTKISGITELPFSIFTATMLPIHLAIGGVEGLITAAVLSFIYETKSSLLWGIVQNEEKQNSKLSFKSIIIVLSICALVISGGLSLVASAKPDGLEWSMEKITGQTELEANVQTQIDALKIQEKTSILPDYNFKDSESMTGTSFSGIIGGLFVFAFAFTIGILIKLCSRKKTKKIDENI